MSLTVPYRQHNYLGELADDAAALSFVQTLKWDSAGDGTGNPRNGMWYYQTGDHAFRCYKNGAWADMDTTSVAGDGAGRGVKEPVRLATVAALPASTSSGSGVGKRLTGDAVGALAVDGVNIEYDERVLVKDEATGSDNGVYKVIDTGGGSTKYILERTTDFDGSPVGEVVGGVMVMSQEGNLNADRLFKLTTDDTIIIDTTVLSFTSITDGDLVGPASSTDNAIARFDGTTGKLVQNSGVTISDTGQIATIKTATCEEEYDNGNSGSVKTVDWNNGLKQTLTLTGNCTLTFTVPPGPCNLILRLVQDATGGRTVTWPASVKKQGGVLTLSTGANAIDIAAIYYNGTTFFVAVSRDFS